MAIINCRNLTKKYTNKLALDDVSFSIDENRIIGLIGRNGAGKSTLLKTCAGYIRPTSGDITLWDEPIFNNMNVLSRLIFINEDMRFHHSLKLKDIIKLSKIYYANWDNELATKLFNYFNLDIKLKYAKLSTGMKSQFNFIMGICSRMSLTLFDEPTLGLDAAVRKEFYNILLKDFMDNPRTIIISSHMLHELENLLEEIIIIKNGKFLMQEPIDVIQNYSVSLNGARKVIIPFIESHKTLFENELGDSITAGIENNLTKKDIYYLNENNVEINKISSEDTCVYLTSNTKEGEIYDIIS
ncbi:ABC transporter [Vallitalea longa]|uniref:ABC transporter n=1 Tax=Vallitalea longa TaxID=2936439 RepID=A0A9W5YE64_9FIRM|nr:ABC transporter ATP-binding protein [Vallitalea longa]GKX31409.1 ABC transporter [Vallitalea longa]